MVDGSSRFSQLWSVISIMIGLVSTTPLHAATPCPAHRPVPEDFQWGLVAYHVNLPGYDLHANDLTRIAQNGIRWIRIDFAWGRIEPKQGSAFDFSYFDNLVAEAHKNGLHIAATLGNGYNTSMRPVASLWTQKLTGPQYVAALSRYANAVTERYADDVDSWALENELQFSLVHVLLGWRHWVYSDETNQYIMRTLSQAVVLHDPSAQIVLTLSPMFSGWEGFVRQSAQRFRFDAVGLYSYPFAMSSAEPVGSEEQVAAQIALAKQASGGKAVLIFETGYPTPRRNFWTLREQSATARAYQATYVQTMIQSAIDGGAMGIYFYQYLDNSNEWIPQERVFGLVEANRTPKPAWNRYGEIISACSGPAN